MNKRNFLAAALICICAGAFATGTETGLVAKVQDVLSRLTRFTFDKLVTDEIIKQAVADLHGQGFYSWNVNTLARHRVFEYHIRPVFKDEAQYSQAMYASLSGSEWHFNHYALPLEIREPLDACRETIMELGRGYLKSPDNLWSFYEAKKALVVAKLHKQGDADGFRQWLHTAKSGMEEFSDARFQSVYIRYVEAYDKWVQSLPTQETDKESSNKAWLAMDNLKTELGRLTPDLYASLFAGRRHKEGGQALVR